MKPLAIDLGCGGGGASVGLYRAGFRVIGIDIDSQPDYPKRLEDGAFNFWKTDAMTLGSWLREGEPISLVWASMPCQAYTWSAKRWNKKYPDLISPIRIMLESTGLPFVLENVPGAPIRHDLMLCGCMFGLRVFKRRYFEVHGFEIGQPMHGKHTNSVKNGDMVTTAGHGGDGSARLRDWQNALGIDWISDKHTLAQAIPPAYGEYIGRGFLEWLEWKQRASAPEG
jgi:hypothetical protein